MQAKHAKLGKHTIIQQHPRWNPAWCGDGAYLTKWFLLKHEQEEVVSAMLLDSSIANNFLCLDFIKSGRIWVSAAFLSWASLCNTSVWSGWLKLYIKYTHHSSHNIFSPVMALLEFCLRRWNMIDLKVEIKNKRQHSNVYNIAWWTCALMRVSGIILDWRSPWRWKDIQTYTHTYTNTHARAHTSM